MRVLDVHLLLLPISNIGKLSGLHKLAMGLVARQGRSLSCVDGTYRHHLPYSPGCAAIPIHAYWMAGSTLIILLFLSLFCKKLIAWFFLQPTHARSALPCWDEPHLKATISVTLISRQGTVNLSNMSARSDVAVADTFTEHLFEGVKDGGWYATSFETTPPVSIECDRSPYPLMAE